MALKLPDNGYSAMQLINYLANAGLVGEVEWVVAEKDGAKVLLGIKANLNQPVPIETGSSVVIGARRLVVAGPKGNGKAPR